MATYPLVASNVKPGGGIVSAVRAWFTSTKSYMNPMSTPQPMTENDIQKHLYPTRPAFVECRLIDNEKEG